MRKAGYHAACLVLAVCSSLQAYHYDGFGYTLYGDEHLDLATDAWYCLLYDASSLRVAGPVAVDTVEAFDSSRVEIAGGFIGDPAQVGTMYLLRQSQGSASGLCSISSLGILEQASMVLDAATFGDSRNNFSFVHALGQSTVRYRSGTVYSFEARQNSTVSLEDWDTSPPNAGPSLTHLTLWDHSSLFGRTSAIGALGAAGNALVDVEIHQPEAVVYLAGSAHGRIAGHVRKIEVEEQADMELVADAQEVHLDGVSARIGGNIQRLYAHGLVSIFSGQVDQLYNRFEVEFVGQAFELGEGLSLQDGQVIGSGVLRGQWLDRTPWETYINQSEPEAVVRLVPEPGSLLIMLMGFLLLNRRSRC